jgi:hypothetical protein
LLHLRNNDPRYGELVENAINDLDSGLADSPAWCALNDYRRTDQRYAELERQHDYLLKLHERVWEESFRWSRMPLGFGSPYMMDVGFFGGLPIAIGQVDGQRFLQNASDLFRRAPLFMVTFQDPLDIDRLAASPFLGRLSNIRFFFTHLGDTGAAQLATSPHLGRLTSLGLGNCSIGDQGVQALARSPQLAGLIVLDLSNTGTAQESHNRITDAGAEALALSPYLNRLEQLEIWGNPFGEHGTRLLRERFGDRAKVIRPRWRP